MNLTNLNFTHYWVTGFGWEVTIFLPTDFVKVEYFGKGDGYLVFIGISDSGGQHILKGNYEK